MKKYFIVISMMLFNYSTTLLYSKDYISLSSEKDFSITDYNRYKVIESMKYYHSLYGKNYVAYESLYLSIMYYCKVYEIEPAFAFALFAIESGFTYSCSSWYNANGLGQVTKYALNEFNNHYHTNIPYRILNDKLNFNYNIMVSLGYMRICWDKYSIIKTSSDLIKAYNVGISNLIKIKNGESSNYWINSSNNYYTKFKKAYDIFIKCRNIDKQ